PLTEVCVVAAFRKIYRVRLSLYDRICPRTHRPVVHGERSVAPSHSNFPHSLRHGSPYEPDRMMAAQEKSAIPVAWGHTASLSLGAPRVKQIRHRISPAVCGGNNATNLNKGNYI